ncbi:sugar transferase [Falsibacillus albus]|uniref:sugar transferase n=1 Tax=Falsibacillus albus TaxID=2478915 RepID=UPI00267DC81E|nr:sugar transferase [Falsibacillus albus]
MKRLFDLTMSLVLIICFLPLFLVVAISIWMMIGGPIIFKQQRPGLNNRPFSLYKFRTMTDRRGPEGELLPDFQRMTRIGSFLRKYSLDELPQLFNVVKGELSLVGPRPLLMEYLPLYNLEQIKRHDVKPGITGWAQINGRNSISWDERFSLDVWYVQHCSFRLDLKIILITIVKVIQSKGINQADSVTMAKFQGSGAFIHEEHG